MAMMDTANWSAWGIRPDYLESLLNDPNFAQKIRAAAENPDAVAAVSGKRAGEDKGYKVVDGVAVIPVVGPLAKRMSFMLWIMGGRTFGQLTEMVYEAADDPEVDAIVLDVDSPGGTVSGTDAFSDVVATAAAVKPVVAFANGCMCSAAYWTGSAASMVITERTAAVGSIGVLMVHADFSKMDEKFGVKYTVLTAGKFKAVGNDYGPLSDEDKQVLQAELDKLYQIFVGTVAENRGVSIDAVISKMADGRVFIGSDAVDAGLADRTGNLQDAIDAARELADQVFEGTIELPIISTGATPPKKEQQLMSGEKKITIVAPTTVAELTAAFPDLAEALRSEGVASVDVDAATGAERDRVLGLAKVHFGADAGGRFVEIVESGVSEAQYKAICGDNAPGQPAAGKIEGADKILEGLKGSGAGNPGADNGSLDLEAGDKDFMALVDEHMAAFKCSKVDAMQAVMKKNPKAHEAYLQKHN
jgi:signal peptide peptidase SppA